MNASPGITGIYYALEEATLLQMRDDILAQMRAARTGTRYESMNVGGKAFTKSNMTYLEMQQELLEINAALQHIDPTTYGKRTRRLVVSFNGS
jgi:hypothetical protein